MKGNITTRQKCPVCGGSMPYDPRRGGCFCIDHPKIMATGQFIVRFKTIWKEFTAIDAAEQFLNGLRHETTYGKFDSRDYASDQPLAFDRLAREYLEEKKRSGMKTFGNVRNYMNRAIAHFGPVNVKTLTKRDLKIFLYGLTRANGEHMTEKTRANYASALQNFFHWFLVYELELLTADQVPRIPPIPYRLNRRKQTDIETQMKIIDEVKRATYEENPKIWLAIDILSLHTKLRPGDILRVNESDVDHENGIITFWRPTKRRDDRAIRIRLIPEHIAEIKKIRIRFPGLPSMPFFRHTSKTRGVKSDQPFGQHFLWKKWTSAAAKFGIHDLDLYGGTRHSRATYYSIKYGKEKARDLTGHDTNKAFDRYIEVDDLDDFEFVQAAAAERKGKIIDIKKRGNQK